MRTRGCLKFESEIRALVSRSRCSVLHAASQNRDRTKHRPRYGPGSAAHRSAKCYALRCVRGTERRRDDDKELQPLPRRRLALALALAGLFVGAVAAVGAAGDGA